MNKTELIALAAERAGATQKDTERILEAVLGIVTETLGDGDRVQLTGFGTFEVKERAARVGRNPHTGETTKIPATQVVSFKPGKGLKDTVAGQGG
ncbi:MAG: HU family DNA-binding protein [Oscillospiraceae bacterium]|jgi:DNA-binding protein HU-beta|nr:HU family DNA-binding protein [Oscillospiraceae bacterium]MBQ5711762.1 HU family DNA-binding protein [Oscillospiraceae bacterium]